MRNPLVVLLLICTCAGLATAQKLLPASVAAGTMPLTVPTFKDAHEATVRLVRNETGWRTLPDINAIIRVLVHGSGGRRVRDYQGAGYGIDYSRYMIFAAQAGLRTFPADDPWAYPVMVERYGVEGEAAKAKQREMQRKVANTIWTSAMKLDCSEPDTWAATYPTDPWSFRSPRRKSHEDLCHELVAITKRMLQGKFANWCRTKTGEPATPELWGGLMDRHRVRANWEELICDAPGAVCPKDFDWTTDPSRTECAWNKYYRIKHKQPYTVTFKYH